MHNIFLKYGGDVNKWDWAKLSQENEIIQQGVNSTFEEIMNTVDFKSAKIYCFIATPDILIKEVTVPQGLSETKAKKLIPNILEDSLLSEIEEIHFSYKPMKKGLYSVAMINKNKLLPLYHFFKEKQIYLEALSPLAIALPVVNNGCRIWLNKEFAYVKMGQSTGYCIEIENLSDLIKLQNEEAVDQIIVNSDQNAVNLPFNYTPEKSDLWHLLARGISEHNVNLLQGEFSYKKPFEMNKAIRFHLTIASILCGVLLVSAPLFHLYQLHHINEGFKEDIFKEYKEIYPASSSMINPRSQMEQELKLLSHNASGDFLELLHFAGASIHEDKGLTIKSIIYRNKELTLSIESNQYEKIENLLKKLKKSKYHVDQKNTGLSNNVATSTLVIKK